MRSDLGGDEAAAHLPEPQREELDVRAHAGAVGICLDVRHATERSQLGAVDAVTA